jgi:hypothetical protein
MREVLFEPFKRKQLGFGFSRRFRAGFVGFAGLLFVDALFHYFLRYLFRIPGSGRQAGAFAEAVDNPLDLGGRNFYGDWCFPGRHLS